MGGHHGSYVAGRSRVSCPVYSHLTYYIVPGETLVIDRPDVVILEGLNVLQTGSDARRDPPVFVSDFFDFSIYVDAPEHAARRWYIERVLLLRATAFKESASDFHRYAALSDEAAEQVAGEIWDARSTAQTPREHPADARARPPHPSQGRGSLPRTTCAHCGFVFFDRPPR